MANRMPRPRERVLGEGEPAHGGDGEKQQRVRGGQEGAVDDVLDDRHFLEQPGEVLERGILGQKGRRVGEDLARRLEGSGNHPEQRRQDQDGQQDEEHIGDDGANRVSHDVSFP